MVKKQADQKLIHKTETETELRTSTTTTTTIIKPTTIDPAAIPTTTMTTNKSNSIHRFHSSHHFITPFPSQSSLNRSSNPTHHHHHHHQSDARSLSRSNSFDSSTTTPHSPNLDSPSSNCSILHHQITPTSSNPILPISSSSHPSIDNPLIIPSSSQLLISTPTTSNHPSNPSSSSTTLFDPLPHLPSRLRQATLKLVPPPNFGFIEGSLFRSGEPAELSLKFIERLNLNSLLWLAPQPPSLKFQEFLSLNSIQFHNLGIQHAASIDAVTEDAVTHALKLILKPSIYPLMIMCGGGSHRTGTVVGCLRKLQGWNLASIFEEYRRYAGAQHHIMNEQFIEFYDINRLFNGSTDGEIDRSIESSSRFSSAGDDDHHPTINLSPTLPQPTLSISSSSFSVRQLDRPAPNGDRPSNRPLAGSGHHPTLPLQELIRSPSSSPSSSTPPTSSSVDPPVDPLQTHPKLDRATPSSHLSL